MQNPLQEKSHMEWEAISIQIQQGVLMLPQQKTATSSTTTLSIFKLHPYRCSIKDGVLSHS